MAKHLHDDSLITSIANAIRAKTGKSSSMTVSQMPAEINAIQTGSTIRNQNKTFDKNGVYTADSGYTGLGTVTVSVPSESASIESLFNGVTTGYKLAKVWSPTSDINNGSSFSIDVGNTFTDLMLVALPDKSFASYCLHWYQWHSGRPNNIAIGQKPSTGTQYQSGSSYITNPTVSGTTFTATVSNNYGVIPKSVKYLVLYQ